MNPLLPTANSAFSTWCSRACFAGMALLSSGILTLANPVTAQKSSTTSKAERTVLAVQRPVKIQRDTLLPRNVLYYGKEARQPAIVALVAGPLRLTYENGSLRYVRLGDYEVVRAMYPTLRDQNWRTYLPEIRDEKIEKQANSFRISYQAHYDTDGVRFRWACVIEGKSDGTIRFSLDGESLSDFQKNRLGICVLHPIQEQAGKPCDITRPDGTKYTGQFPWFIQPDQPFKNIKSMTWSLPAPLQGSASLAFDGEVFETEDQRNYGDASYKTYCTPQERPKPVAVKLGDHFQQSVELQLQNIRPTVAAGKPSSQLVISTDTKGTTLPFPAIGLGQSSEEKALSEREITYLKRLHLSHYRVEVVTGQPDWKEKLQRSLQESKQLGVPLEIAFYPAGNPVAEAAEFLRQCPSEQATLSSMAIYASGDLSEVIRTLKEGYPNTQMGTGTSGSFVELNNRPPNPKSIEFLTYATQPQTHLFDNRNIIENITGQAYQVESAKKLADSLTGRALPVRVGPVSLRGRRYPILAMPRNPALVADVRQMSLFGAGFTVGSLKALAESGASSATFYETVGTYGLMQVEKEPLAPEEFKAPARSVYPVYYVFQALGMNSNTRLIKSQSTNPLAFDGLVLANAKSKRILLANYLGNTQSIQVTGLSGQATIRFLDETNAQEAMLHPEQYLGRAGKKLVLSKGQATIVLKPYALAFIDLVEQ